MSTHCELCVKSVMHYPEQCQSRCPQGDSLKHTVVATYQNYGYWRGQCIKCSKVWEVDSSG